MTTRRFLKLDKQRPETAEQYDWGGPDEEGSDYLPAGATVALAHLHHVCQHWIEQGGLIVRYSNGFDKVLAPEARPRPGRRAAPDAPRVWEVTQAQGYVSPFGALLHGVAATPAGTWMDDAMRVLEVDPYWLVGFLHGFDDTSRIVIGKRMAHFEESAAYVAGHKAGEEIAARYLTMRGGYDAVAREG